MENSDELDLAFLQEFLGPDVIVRDPKDVPPAPVATDEDLITFHDIRNKAYEKHVRRNEVFKKPSSRHPYTPPTVAEKNPAKAKELAAETFEQYRGLKQGDYAQRGTCFTHWSLVEMYQHSYIGKKNRAKAAYLFDEILNGLPWDFFYVYNPRYRRNRAKLFVPTEQFERFLDFVNATIGIQLCIPEGPPGNCFRLVFNSEGVEGPRFAGRITHSNEFDQLVENLPDADERDQYRDAPMYSVDDLVNKLHEMGGDDDKERKKEDATRSREANTKRKIGGLQLCQHLLGLRPQSKGQRLGEGGQVITLDVNKPRPFEPYGEPVFVAIDIEADELSSQTILEVGVAVLDTREIAGVAPGKNGENWFSLIKAHHLQTYEYRSQRNSKFVKGCPDMFHFGNTEQPTRGDLGKRLRDIIGSYINSKAEPQNWILSRNLILVGHDFDSDLRYLKSFGVKPSNFFTFRGIVDSQDMDQVSHDLPNGRSLGAVLNELEVFHKYLHNAGNDAVYTMQAMIALAIESRLEEVRQVEELERELGPDGPLASYELEKTEVLKAFDEEHRKKLRPGETREQWSYRIYGR